MDNTRYWLTLSLTLFVLFGLACISTAGPTYDQAPALEEKVASGELPPVEQRLPDNPLVIEPLNDIGKYGGTWNRFSTAEGWSFFVMAMDGNKFARFLDEKGLPNAPHLVREWESNEDKSSWTFHFRKGLKWSDGQPLTVDDFLFWWNDMARNPEQAAVCPEWAKAGGELMEVEKIDDYTLKFEFSASNPFLIDYLSMWSSNEWAQYIFPSHYLKQFHPDYTDEYDNFETFSQKLNRWRNTELPVVTAWELKREKANLMVFERNPYYYAVDPEGNQLPYIDKVSIRYVADNEVFKLKMIKGEADMQIRPFVLSLRDVASLKRAEEKGNFETLLWAEGRGSGPVYFPNHNHPDPEKRKLYRDSKFLKALSHAVNRPKIQKVVFYGMGYQTNGTYTMKTPTFQSEKGGQVFEEWRNASVEYDLAKSKKLLDEVGVVDQDGDGWREMPSGKDLELRIDLDSETVTEHVDTSEIIKSSWRGIGLKTIVNPVSGAKLGTMQTNATFDIRNSWAIGDGSSVVGQPEWLIPVASDRWSPLYGAWWSVQGTAKEDTELDKSPRDRHPPREEPKEGGPVDRLQQLYKKAKTMVDREKRNKLVWEMIDIHIEEGPFLIGTVGDWPRPGIVKNYFKNVPEKLSGGWISDWHISYPAVLNPDTFYIDKG